MVKTNESEVLTFGNEKFVLGETFSTYTFINSIDRKRLQKEILSSNNGIKILSIHYHFEWYKSVPYFLSQLVEESIENGINIAMCHGPHTNKFFEITEKYVIFWGLGNFIYHLDDLNIQPKEFDTKYNIPKNITDNQEKLEHRKKLINNNPSINEENWFSFIPEVITVGNNIKEVKIYPITLDFNNKNNHKGWPSLCDDFSHVEKLISKSKISESFKKTYNTSYISFKYIENNA